MSQIYVPAYRVTLKSSCDLSSCHANKVRTSARLTDEQPENIILAAVDSRLLKFAKLVNADARLPEVIPRANWLLLNIVNEC